MTGDISQKIEENPFISGILAWIVVTIIFWVIQQSSYFILNFFISNNDPLQSFSGLIDFLPILGFIIGLTLFLANIGIKTDLPWIKR